jgi:hypothetical protein
MQSLPLAIVLTVAARPHRDTLHTPINHCTSRQSKVCRACEKGVARAAALMSYKSGIYQHGCCYQLSSHMVYITQAVTWIESANHPSNVMFAMLVVMHQLYVNGMNGLSRWGLQVALLLLMVLLAAAW